MQKLFIDIDDTLVRYREGAAGRFDQPLLGHDLFSWMCVFVAANADMDAQVVEAVIRRVHKEKTWWDWNDYLDALSVSSDAFWDYALQKESQYLEPIDTDLPQVMQRLRDAGFELFITSNNPVSGIRHKLRIAGLGAFLDGQGFTGMLGTNVVQAMKWAPSFWSKSLKIAGAQAEKVTTIGDTWHDDILAPSEAGIRSHIFLGKPGHRSLQTRGDIHFAQSWTEVEACLITASRGSAADSLSQGQLRRSI